MEEGCLSFPGITVPVKRACELTVEFTTLSGKRKTRRVAGLEAQAVQHEIDHLDGILIADRISLARRLILVEKLRRLCVRGKRGEHR
jgi:peptide deformylase